MSEIVSYALTTRERVKTRIGFDEKKFDDLLDRLVSAVTDFIESQTNRRFKKTTYTNEVYSIQNRQSFLTLKQTPVITLSSFQYSQGLPNNRTWTDVPAADYELDPDTDLSMIRTSFYLTRGISTYRVTYEAGYLIDFDNVNNSSLHTLPADLTDLAERLIIKWYKRREHVGKSSESFQSGTVNWLKEMEDEDKLTIQKYQRLQFI
jgi:hypothetical protein